MAIHNLYLWEGLEMELKVLRNFLVVADLGNMTHAAEALRISQPALSVQIKRLEAELGRQLFIRESRHLVLTEEGRLLHQRAQTLVDLADKTVAEFSSMDQLQGGEIKIGCAEAHLLNYVAHAFKSFRAEHPRTQFNLSSGGTMQVLEKLAEGSIDIAVIVEPPQLDRYNCIQVPENVKWGAAFPAHHPLAQLDSIRVNDLLDHELIISKQSLKNDLPRWAGENFNKLKFSGYYNLAFNGAVFAQAGLGILLAFDHLVECTEESGLVFRPLEPALENSMYVIWQKNQQLSPLAKKFISYLQQEFETSPS